MFSILLKDYANFTNLDEGTYGKVLKAKHKASKIKVAIELIQNCFKDA